MTKQKREDIRAAVREAEEFIRRAKKVAIDFDSLEMRGSSTVFCDTRLSSSMRRQSMELTRALADLRRAR